VNEIFTVCFVINGGGVDVIVRVRGMFNDSLRCCYGSREAFIFPLVLPEQTIDWSNSLCEYKEKYNVKPRRS
jgi:hypothetical protein